METLHSPGPAGMTVSRWRNSCWTVARIFFTRTKKDKLLFSWRARNERTKTVQLLLDRSCHVDLGDSHGSTPLLVACQNGHWRTVRLLLDQGANLEHRDKRNRTALALASVAGHVDTVRILMERGSGIQLGLQWETSKGSRVLCTRAPTWWIAFFLVVPFL
jgi:ankyrin repeat protein